MEDHSDSGKKKAQYVFAFIALVLIMLGQIFLYTTPVVESNIFPAAGWLCLAGLALFLIVYFVRLPQKVLALFDRLPLHGPLPWLVLAVALSALAVVGMISFEQAKLANFLPVISFWLMAGACYLIAFRPPLSRQTWVDWFRSHRVELIQIGAVTLLGIALRLYRLGSVPRVINGDEGWTGMTALSTASGELANPFALWQNFGALYLQVINTFITLFGQTPLALRIAPTIGGILAIPAVYLLARKLTNRRVGLVAASLLAFSHTHISFSRAVAVGYIQGTWLIPLELYFLFSGIEKRSSWRAAVAGILLATHFSIYLSSQVVVGLVIIFTAVSWLFFRSWFRPALRQVLVFWGAFAVMILPEAVYVSRNFGSFITRLNADGTFQTGWLANEVLVTGRSAVSILAQRVLHAFMSLIYYPAFDFYGTSIPMLSLVSSMLFLVGLGYVLIRFATPQFLLMNIYFWGFTFSIGIFAIPPSADSYRMLVVLPAAFIFAGIGLDQILHLLGVGWDSARRKYLGFAGAILVSLFIYNISAYYIDFAGRCRYGQDFVTRFASYLGQYADTVDPDARIYLLSDQEYFYGPHQSVHFLSHNREITNVPDSIDSMSYLSGDIVVAIPGRVEELRQWAREHPGNELYIEYDCKNPAIVSYEVP